MFENKWLAMSGVLGSIACKLKTYLKTSKGTVQRCFASNLILLIMALLGFLFGSRLNAFDSVLSLTFDSTGNLYAGGDFTTVGGVTVNNIAKWDGTKWSAIGSGMNRSVSSLAVDSSGNLYAGGDFSTAGGVTANNIAKWDGTKWSAIDSGLGPVYIAVLAVDSSGNLYAGGELTTTGGGNANDGIAKWDGASWSALGSGTDGFVTALTFDSSGNLYSGGTFTTAGGVPANNIAKWNPATSNWSALGSGVECDFVWALAFDSSGNLYAGGNMFTSAGGVPAKGIAKWNPTTSKWSALGSGMKADDSVLSLTFDSSGNLYAGGYFTTAGGVTANNIAKWDGTSWSALGSGTNYQVNALAFDSSGNLYAGGYFTTAGGVTVNGIAKWDGTKWSALGATISGTVTGAVQQGVALTLSGAGSATTPSDSYGCFAFVGLSSGSYTVTPRLSGYTFTPMSRNISISGADVAGCDFTATAIIIHGLISKPSFNASHKDAVKKIAGTYTQYFTDKFTVQATIQFSAGFDLTTIGENTGFTFNFGTYSFSNTLGNAFKKKLDGAKGGNASFTVTENDEIKGKTVTVEKVDLRWDKKKKLTVKITGTPASNTDTNVVDLSGKADGTVTGTIDIFELIFNNAGATFAKGESLPYTGKKKTSTVIKDKGKPSEKTFTIVDWSAKGKK